MTPEQLAEIRARLGTMPIGSFVCEVASSDERLVRAFKAWLPNAATDMYALLAHVEALGADNAALVEALGAAHPCKDVRCMACFRRMDVVQNLDLHPGTALLEENRRLRARVAELEAKP